MCDIFTKPNSCGCIETMLILNLLKIPFLAYSSIVQKNKARHECLREIINLCVKLASANFNIREILEFQSLPDHRCPL